MNTISRYKLQVNKTEIEKMQISNSRQAYDYIKQFYSDDIEIYESFYIMLLNRANHVIGYAKISQGGIVGTYVDKKIIFKYIVDSLASGVILAHNHPSGNLKPSNQDIKITNDIKELAKLLDTDLLDHLILSTGGFYSFADEGQI